MRNYILIGLFIFLFIYSQPISQGGIIDLDNSSNYSHFVALVSTVSSCDFIVHVLRTKGIKLIVKSKHYSHFL